jgi:hypothetical protein
VEGLVAEDGEGFDAVDAVTSFGVDSIGGEVVRYVEGGKEGVKRLQDLEGTVVGATLDNR